KPLDGDKAVASLLAGLLGRIEHARERRIEIDLASAAARNLRALGQRRLDGGQGLPRVAPRPVDQAGGEPLGVVEQHLQQVLGRKLLMSLAQRERLGRLNETAAAVGIFVEIHVPSLGLFRRPNWRDRNIVMGLQLRRIAWRCRDPGQNGGLAGRADPRRHPLANNMVAPAAKGRAARGNGYHLIYAKTANFLASS